MTPRKPLRRALRTPTTGPDATAAAQAEILRQLRQQAAAELLGWSARTLRDSSAPRNADGSYVGRRLVAWAIERAVERARPGAVPSTHLERLRAARADEAERRGALERGELIRATAMRAQLSDVVRLWRAELEAMERVHGGAVGEDLRKCIDRVESEFRRRWPDPNVEVPQLGPAPAEAPVVQSISQPAGGAP